MKKFTTIIAMLFITSAFSQTINIGPDQYAFRYTSDPDFGLFFNATDARYEFRNGSAAPVLGFSANNGALTTNLSFSSGSDLLIANNRYAFRASSNPNYGLFFDGTTVEYQFLDNTATPVFAVNGNTGEISTDIEFSGDAGVLVKPNTFGLRSATDLDAGLFFGGAEYQFKDLSGAPVMNININNGNTRIAGGLRLGPSALNQAGNIRWTGSDFQGYNGSSWASLTTGPAGPQGPQGPQGPAGLLPNGTTNAVPRFTGTTWDVTHTGMINDGTSVGIGGNPYKARLYVNGLTVDSVIEYGSVIDAYRYGLIGSAGPLTNWGNADVAIRGTVNWGNSYSAAVYGNSLLHYSNSAAVIGFHSSSVYGALAYKNGTGELKAGYFNGDIEGTGDIDLAGSASFADSVSVGTTLDVAGATDLGSTLNVAERITVANSATDSIGIDLDGGGNYYQSDNWVFGESDGVGPAVAGDYIMSRGGTQHYIFWTGYLRPVEDNIKSLGRSSGRWSTVYASNGTINTSDAREKKNIKKLDYGLQTLMQLNPVSYEWKEDVANMGTKLGFVAQDLLELIPEVVVTEEAIENRETGEVTYREAERMGVFYDDLIPVLTKAIQEQQGTIEQQDETIERLTEKNDELTNQVNKLLDRVDLIERDLQTCCFNSQSGVQTGSDNSSTEAAELGQNIPNPFSESTVIRYYLPEGTTNAIIRITDMEGSPVEDLQLGATFGANQVDFLTQGLASGTYLYSLFVDGKFVDTKKMMIAR